MKYVKSKIVRLHTKEATNIVSYDIITNENGIDKSKEVIKLLPKEHKADELLKISYIPQHLYFLSNEKIKEGDWCLIDNNVGQSIGYQVLKCEKSEPQEGWYYFKDFKTGRCTKIIATTDKSLKIESELDAYYRNGIGGAKSIPKPSNEFLKKYCELGGIDECLVEYEKFWINKSKKYKPYNIQENIQNTKKEYRLKVAPDNTITIKPVESEFYTREEVINLFNKWLENYHQSNETAVWKSSLDNWIKENLK